MRSSFSPWAGLTRSSCSSDAHNEALRSGCLQHQRMDDPIAMRGSRLQWSTPTQA